MAALVTAGDVDPWLRDLDDDYELVHGIADDVADIGPEDDDKLQSIKKFLNQPAVDLLAHVAASATPL